MSTSAVPSAVESTVGENRGLQSVCQSSLLTYLEIMRALGSSITESIVFRDGHSIYASVMSSGSTIWLTSGTVPVRLDQVGPVNLAQV